MVLYLALYIEPHVDKYRINKLPISDTLSTLYVTMDVGKYKNLPYIIINGDEKTVELIHKSLDMENLFNSAEDAWKELDRTVKGNKISLDYDSRIGDNMKHRLLAQTSFVLDNGNVIELLKDSVVVVSKKSDNVIIDKPVEHMGKNGRFVNKADLEVIKKKKPIMEKPIVDPSKEGESAFETLLRIASESLKSLPMVHVKKSEGKKICLDCGKASEWPGSMDKEWRKKANRIIPNSDLSLDVTSITEDPDEKHVVFVIHDDWN